MHLKTTGIADWAAKFLQQEQLKDREQWKKFVEVYRSQPDAENNGWKGEFWGKMMRGGCLVYEYTQDEELYDVLTESVKDMLSTAEADGRVSTYKRDKEFDAWDLWCRKYVILANEYYLDICKDAALKEQIITFICRAADYILLHIGNGEGQKNINEATRSWYGLNSSSILEPMVRLYHLTKEQRYLDFASYIVKEGGAKGINVFRLAYENEIYPYQYGVSKAYEMTSCFEGLLEYYYATGEEWCKTAVINFADALIKTEISVIGCSGITHELFDFTAARQTVRQPDVLQETCVTVTWMKFCSRVLELTGDAKYADCIEQSFYNAYLGSFNTDRKICANMYERFVVKKGITDLKDTYLPIDSYSPLLSGKRGRKVGGNQLMPDHSYYGCCTCIASAGIGVFMKNMVTADQDGITVNFFEKGTASLTFDGAFVTITQDTAYPIDGKITLTVTTDTPKEFALRVRIPGWTGKEGGYAVTKKVWSQDTLSFTFDMPVRTLLPQIWEKEVIYTDMSNFKPGDCHVAKPITVYHDPADDHYVALMRGPLTLAADSRSGKDADSVFDFEPDGTLCEDNTITDGVPCLLKMRFTDKRGEDFYLVDYASAGKDWETVIAAWLRTK